MKFTTTLAVFAGLFIGFGIANPVPEAGAAVDAQLERRCTPNYGQYHSPFQRREHGT